MAKKALASLGHKNPSFAALRLMRPKRAYILCRNLAKTKAPKPDPPDLSANVLAIPYKGVALLVRKIVSSIQRVVNLGLLIPVMESPLGSGGAGGLKRPPCSH